MSYSNKYVCVDCGATTEDPQKDERWLWLYLVEENEDGDIVPTDQMICYECQQKRLIKEK